MTCPPSRRLRFLIPFFLLPFSFFLQGCAILGVGAAMMPPPTIQPRYTGLAGEKVGVMVWTDPGIRIDWPAVQVDLANAVQNKLIANPKAKSLLKTTYPVQPASIARYQQDHPEVETMPVTEVAPRLGGLSRLI